MWLRCVVVLAAATSLVACSGAAGGNQSLIVADKAFLQKLEELGGKVSGNGAQADAINVGRAFCGERQSGATQAEARQTVDARYLGVGREAVQKAAAAANASQNEPLSGSLRRATTPRSG